MKTCSACNKSKPLSEFYSHDSSGYIRNDCKKCVIDRKRERKYGITYQDYLEILSSQDNRCAICKIPIDEYRLKYKRYNEFAVDHDHETDQIRGLLCHNCNRAIGMLQDDVEIIKNAERYLEKNIKI